jgi:hypothetical protein
MPVVLKCSGIVFVGDDQTEIQCAKIALMDTGMALWYQIQRGPAPVPMEVGYPTRIYVDEVEWSVLDDDPTTQAPPACDRCNDDPTSQPTGVCPKCFAGYGKGR